MRIKCMRYNDAKAPGATAPKPQRRTFQKFSSVEPPRVVTTTENTPKHGVRGRGITGKGGTFRRGDKTESATLSSNQQHQEVCELLMRP